jgi:hypothetical protein
MTLVDEVVDNEPVAPSKRSTRHRWRWIGAFGGAGAILCAALAIAAIPTDDGGSTIVEQTGEAPAAPTSTLPPVVVSDVIPEPVPPATPERLSASSRLRLDGIGPVLVGMTLEEASAAAGMPIRIVPGSDRPGTGACAHARAECGPEGLHFMVVNGRIVRAEVSGVPIRTLSGIGTGNSEADVQATYPGRISVQPNPYTGHRGGRDLVYVPDESSRHLALLFQTDAGQVTSFRSGLLEAVMAPERCA